MVNGQFCKLDMNLQCSDSHVIYMAQCKHCKRGFYFGQTWMTVSNCMNGHRSVFRPGPGQYHKSALSLHISEMHSSNLPDKLDNFDIGFVKKCIPNDLNMIEDNYIKKFKARIIGLNRN